MKIYKTALPGTMDSIIKDAIENFGFASKRELLAHFRQQTGSNQPLFIDLLDQSIPNWKDLTSAKDPILYIMNNKLPYRIAKYLD